MRININTEVLRRNNLTLGEFLVMLMGYHNIDYEQCFNHLVKAGIVEPNLFSNMSVILSDNSKNLVAKVLMESDEKVIRSGIDFDGLALKLQDIYPKGIKSGTTYLWGGDTAEIAQKLRVLVGKHGFLFTEEEAINATLEYVNSFKDRKYMQLLKYFILRTTDDKCGHKEINSMFMTIIENNREEKDDQERQRDY